MAGKSVMHRNSIVLRVLTTGLLSATTGAAFAGTTLQPNTGLGIDGSLAQYASHVDIPGGAAVFDVDFMRFGNGTRALVQAVDDRAVRACTDVPCAQAAYREQ